MAELGKQVGEVAGGAIGTAVLPGVGTAIGSKLGGFIGDKIGKKKSGSVDAGAALSTGTGLLQQLQANRLKNQADAAMPELVDPNQSSFLAELMQKRKSIDTGADFAASMNAIDASNAGTNDTLLRATGGDVGGTIQALLQSERASADAKNQALAQGQQQQLQYTGLAKSLLDDVAQRRMELQLQNAQQNRAEWAQMKQNANQNFMAGLSRFATPSQNLENTIPGNANAEIETPSVQKPKTGNMFSKKKPFLTDPDQGITM
jgi:hypothetical protein